MDGFSVFCDIAFGTSFDPKQKKRRKNKLQNYKRNKRLRLEESLKKGESEDGPCVNNVSDNSSDLSESSDTEKKPEPVQIQKKKKKKRLSTMQLFKIRKEELAHFRRIHKIYVTGEDIPDPFENFDQLVTDYEFQDIHLKNIQDLGYLKPTPIQMQAIPLMLHNRQILACAPTGSGKTAAFLVPIIHNLKAPEDEGLRAVIIAPTRELAKQIHMFCVKLSKGTGLRSLIIENVNEAKSQPEIFKKHDILISTPNRLIYLLKNDSPVIGLKKVEWFIVDECDKLFETGKEDTGFRDQLAFIYNACDSSGVKRAMFSATYTNEVEEWCKLNLDSLVCVAIGTKNTAVESVKQELLFTGTEDGKIVAMRNFVTEGFLPPCLIFTQSKERARDLYREISHLCPKMAVIHADLTQAQRDQAVQDFLEGRTWMLVCTELMGRGIDFRGVNVVINYDFPPTAISYIHRIGRTGRAGEEGRAITFFTTDDVTNLKSIAQVIKNAGCEVPDYIMKLKGNRRKKNVFVRPIQRKKISSTPDYETNKKRRKRKKTKKKSKKQKQEES